MVQQMEDKLHGLSKHNYQSTLLSLVKSFLRVSAKIFCCIFFAFLLGPNSLLIMPLILGVLGETKREHFC